METAYKYISLFFTAILAVVIWGFFKSYFGLFPSFSGLSNVHHLHGISWLCWMVLLITQPILIRNRLYRAHRLLGYTSYLIVPLILISLLLVARVQYMKAMARSEEEAVALLALNLPIVFIFSALYVLAMVNKRNTAYHMRYMICTSLLFIGPGLGRVFIIYAGMPFVQGVTCVLVITEIVAVGLILYERMRNRSYKPYAVFMVLFTFYLLIWLMRYSDLWQSFGKNVAELIF